MLEYYGTYEPPSRAEQLRWQNIAVNSLLKLKNKASSTHSFPQLIRIQLHIYGIPVQALIDTGAAATLLSADILFQIKNQNIKKFIKDETVIRTVSGEQLYTYGKFEFPIVINSDHFFTHNFYVIDNLKEDCILGIDFLSMHNVKINTKTRRVDYGTAQGEQTLTPDCPIYSLSIGERELPLLPKAEESISEKPLQTKRKHIRLLPLNFKHAPCTLERYLATNNTFIIHDNSILKDKKPITDAIEEINALVISAKDEEKINSKEYANLKPFQQCNLLIGQKERQSEEEWVKEIGQIETKLKKLPYLNEGQVDIALQVLQDYSDLFSNNDSDLGLVVNVKHYINTGDSAPVRMKARRTPEALREQVWKQIQAMIDNNIIRPSHSAYAAAPVLVRKKDGSLRLCIDFRWLNKVTIRDNFPLPRIDDTIEALYGAQYFSTLDLISGYWQIEINESDKHKTAFICERGLFEFNRMPFGLTNAPSTFQRVMNNIFQYILHKHVLVYLDDIIIYSKTFDDHIEHLREVFQLIRQAGLKLKSIKCDFFKKEIDYLGFIVSKDGIRPNTAKIEAIIKYPEPRNQKELGSYLGGASYYRKYIRNFADIEQVENAYPPSFMNAPCGWSPSLPQAF